ncbi:helix-turn-helix transcriptional regulator [Sagittula sp. SSi028]|uniref:helix-turn-helix transcriptional regulator n=1 Tax=Sagittula sp. SSi028 TaxID=3400636 RepID=UPI003AF90653
MELLSIPEVCQLLRISRSKLYDLWNAGIGPKSVYIGNARRVVRGDLEDWIKDQRAA